MKLGLTCKEATRMISDGQDRSLGIAERALLQAHLLACRGCAAVEKQLGFLRKAMRRLSERE
ncbi:MAG: hypothetical protein K0R40_93 [Burkholderiales bacterium]|jgi:hypothetical protein|nr:hypothetical protein [Burkholderiales bacterium]